MKAPFASTGWKTVGLDHFVVHAADYKKESAYFQALMNWKLRSDDGTKAILDIGDVGSVVIMNGYVAPPRQEGAGGRGTAGGGNAAGAGAGAAGAGAGAAGGAAGAGRGAAGGAGGRGGARIPVQSAWDGYAWAITPWNAKKVEAELKSRGLNPVADNDGKGCESFHVKDPDGFDVQLTNGCMIKQRKAAKAVAKSDTPAPFPNTNWQTVWLDHISFQTPNYKESYEWYTALLGWKQTFDEGSQNEMEICPDCGNALIRGGNPLAPNFSIPQPRRATIGHVSFGITPFDPDSAEAALDSRGLNKRVDTANRGDIRDPKVTYKSYHTTTPMGFDLQFSNASKKNRTVPN
ncbi:MAG: glyoxalase [Gemmatimonas sp.]